MRRITSSVSPRVLSKTLTRCHQSNGAMFTTVGRQALVMNTSTAGERFYSTPELPKATALGDKAMFCFQCEQTDSGKGCSTIGVCGKTPTVSALQDLLISHMRVMSTYAHYARLEGATNDQLEPVNDFLLRGLYSTLTNVNFDESRFVHEYLQELVQNKDLAKNLYVEAATKNGKTPQEFKFQQMYDLTAEMLTDSNIPVLQELGKVENVQERMSVLGTDIASLQELVQFGLKGVAAYAKEASLLGNTDGAVFDFMNEAMAFLSGVSVQSGWDSTKVEDILKVALKVGEINIRVMQMMDLGSNAKYGAPSPANARVTPVPGKCILVSGHDLGDLNAVLQQTEGKDINVYTHGELLPAHGYPELRKYKHLVGNYGGAWQMQKFEFSKFPGSIIMTTNCIVEPRQQYKDRIFTTSIVGFPGVKHLKNRDFSAAIEKALEQPGFPEDIEIKEPAKHVLVGFGHNAVLSIADKVINAIKRGDIKRFFLIGGCDGSEGERNYYKQLATSLPDDNVILTLGCAKYRFNKIDFGTIKTVDPVTDGPMEIPRLLDMGQCNDSYSAVVVASALANAFEMKDLNQLPLSYAISWFEQKAVAVFLTLLHLGIHNIRIGPVLPAFIPPSTLNLLVDAFKLNPIHPNNVKEDLERMSQGL